MAERSVKQPLDPEFVYNLPIMVFPPDCDPNALNAIDVRSVGRSALRRDNTRTTCDQEEICKILQDS